MGVVLERTEPGPLGEKFTHSRFDDFFIASHSKHNCRRCHGRGKLPFDNPSTGLKWVEACGCVFRKKF